MSASNEILNPMHHGDGDPFPVQAALKFLSTMLMNRESTIILDQTDAYGLGVILDTCAEALNGINQRH